MTTEQSLKNSWIDKLQRLFKTDIRYVTSGGFWLGVNEARSIILALAASVALAHFIDKTTYGTYQYLISASTIIGGFSLTGLSIALNQSAAKGFDSSLRLSFKESINWNIPSILIALAGAAYYFLKGNSAFGFAFVVIAIANPLLNSGALFNSYLNGKKDFRKASYYGMYTSVLPTVALIAALFFTKSVLVLILISILGKSLVNIACYYFTARKVPAAGPVDTGMIPYAKHLSVINLLSIVVGQIDSIVVFQLLGPIQLAIYNFSIIIPDRLQVMFRNIITLALPKFAQKSRGELRQSIMQKTVIVILMLIPVILITIFLIPPVYHILFPQYAGSIGYAQIYSASLISILAFLPLASFQSHRLKSELYIVNIGNSIIELSLLCVLTYSFGILGALFARIIARLLNSLLHFYLLLRSKEGAGSAALID